MGGEMVFYHNDKPIEDLVAYKQLLIDIMKDRTTQIPIVIKPLKTWRENERIWLNLKYYEQKLGKDENYAFGIDLGRSTRNTANHYYIMFPKDPNSLKVISNLHARGLHSVVEYDSKNWIHPWLIKFITTFPGVFRLYYGDGTSGWEEEEICYCNGSDVAHRVKPGSKCT